MGREIEWVFPKTCGSCIKLSRRVVDLESAPAAAKERIAELEAKSGFYCTCGNSEFKCLVCEKHMNSFYTRQYINKWINRFEASKERIAELESENARLRAEVERLTALVQEKRS